MKERDITFDIMKGIGILLMLIGHWPGCPHWLHQFIYSFHMPLFFLVAGYFTHVAENRQEAWAATKKNAKRLLLPFAFTQLMLIGWGAIQVFAKGNVDMLYPPILSLIWGGGNGISFHGYEIYVGPMWFLVALFWTKSIFSWLSSIIHDGWLIISCLLLSALSIFAFRYCHSFLPWNIGQGLSCLLFVSIGWWVRNHQVPKWLFLVCLLCWPIAVCLSGMEVSECKYQYYPLDILGACGGTICIYWLSKQLAKVRFLARPLAWCGVYSLVILCFHNFEWFSAIAYSLVIHSPFSLDGNAMVVFRYALVFVMVAVAIHVPGIKSVYGIRTTHK